MNRERFVLKHETLTKHQLENFVICIINNIFYRGQAEIGRGIN